MQRRTFLHRLGPLTLGLPALASGAPHPRPVDFRYAPVDRQAAFCFPDDPHKNLIGEKGDLRLGFDRRRQINYFPYVVEFSLSGMEADRVVSQKLEGAALPVIHTLLERPDAILDLTTFASNRAGEGRVDNVLLEVRPKSSRAIQAAPTVRIRTRQTAAAKVDNGATVITFAGSAAPFLVAGSALRGVDMGDGYLYTAPAASARPDAPLRIFFRFPQAGQDAAQLAAGLRQPLDLLSESRQYWKQWTPFQNGVAFDLPSVYQNFLLACARNILQARERIDGKLTFQVGPTKYRGLWVVDGNFILEAASYLGYGAEAQQGLETTWSMQRANGQVEAAVLGSHWKDTGIAMFSLVRQAELSQDWTYFRKMRPQLNRAVEFLKSIRARADQEGSANGKYGILAKGFGDGGIGGGAREEFTNTIWVLAGLRAVTEAARTQQIDGLEEAGRFYSTLRTAFFAAARQQMRRHPAGFDFLPMLLKEDAAWSDPDEGKRPRPQTGQWALAHGIYPGLVFTPDDPIVQGYLRLMQASTREDVPIETGWLPHEGLWNYDAAFAAHASLAGRRDYSLTTFHGFLNHATPLYVWREEQPLANTLVSGYVGDMPHNWASAECVLYLRHMLALEDGPQLRLLEGIGDPELTLRERFSVQGSPTRFGRIGVVLEPSGSHGWHLKFFRAKGPAPGTLELPVTLGSAHRFVKASGAQAVIENNRVRVSPEATSWEASWSE